VPVPRVLIESVSKAAPPDCTVMLALVLLDREPLVVTQVPSPDTFANRAAPATKVWLLPKVTATLALTRAGLASFQISKCALLTEEPVAEQLGTRLIRVPFQVTLLTDVEEALETPTRSMLLVVVMVLKFSAMLPLDAEKLPVAEV